MEALLKSLLEKISVYDILNNFIPGAVFLIIAEDFAGLKLVSTSIFNKVILCYIAGLIISRIGSIVIEPVCKKFKIVHFASYNDFTAASLKDESGKTERLSMINNVYRTFISVFLCLSVLMMLNAWNIHLSDNKVFQIIVSLAILLLFILSYRKQTQYVSDRVKKILELDSKKKK